MTAPTRRTFPPSNSGLGRPFRRLAAANLAAQTAEQLGLAATPIVAVLLFDAGAAQIGWIAAAQTLPFLLLALPLGMLADRHARRRVLVASEALRVLAFAALVLVVASGQATLAWLALLGALGAVGTVGFSVAAPALVPALVGATDLPRANARLEVARSLAFTAGPALGGALVAALGGGAVFAIATALSLLALAAVWRLPEPARALEAPRPGLGLAAMVQAWRFVWQHATLRVVLLTALVWNLAWFVLQAALVPHAMRTLGLDAAGVGLVLAAYGVGALAGALLAPGLVRRLGLEQALVVGPALSLLAAALVAATLHWPSPVLAVLGMAVFGLGPTIWVVTSTTLRQALTPPEMLGRVGALFLTVNAGARPLGAAIGAMTAGAVAARGEGPAAGEAACLLLALLGFAVQAVLIARGQRRRAWARNVS